MSLELRVLTLKGVAKFKGKLTRGLKIDISNLVNELLLFKAYKCLDETVQKSYVSWHLRVMQILKKNWLLVSKKTWGIWWISMQVWKFALWCATFVESIMLEPKKYRGVMCYNTEKWCKNLRRNWLVLWNMTWEFDEFRPNTQVWRYKSI